MQLIGSKRSIADASISNLYVDSYIKDPTKTYHKLTFNGETKNVCLHDDSKKDNSDKGNKIITFDGRVVYQKSTEKHQNYSNNEHNIENSDIELEDNNNIMPEINLLNDKSNQKSNLSDKRKFN